jgi:hypothetical protein
MKQFILIEDRAQRQRNALGSRLVDLQSHSNLLNISGGAEFDRLRKNFENGDFSLLSDYSTIMLHRSAFSTETRSRMIDFIKSSKRKVVMFSGGITGCQMTFISGLEILLLNVNLFYSDSLFLFLDSRTENLLELAFGEKWKASILLDTLDRFNLYMSTYVDRPLSIIDAELELNEWTRKNYFSSLSMSGKVSKIDLITVRDAILNDLIKLI